MAANRNVAVGAIAINVLCSPIADKLSLFKVTLLFSSVIPRLSRMGLFTIIDKTGDIIIREGDKVVDRYPKWLLDTYPHDSKDYDYSE